MDNLNLNFGDNNEIIEIDGKEYKKPPIMDGWGIFDKEQLKEIKDKRLLKHIYAGVSGACDLHCIYCQTKSGKPIEGEMTLEERKKLMDEFNALGGEIVHIAGRGEPTYDPLFWDQLEYMHTLGLKPLIFTHGGNLDADSIAKLKKTNSSIILKVHSFDEQLQDWFAGKKGYTKRRNNGLELLMEAGFNYGVQTKLGFDILVMKKNLHEIENIFRFCRKNNIFPLVKPFLTNEKAATKFIKDNLQVTALEVKELYDRLSYIDREEFGYGWRPSPPYAGIHCNYYLYHIMVTIMGDVAGCIGLPYIGNIKDKSLEQFWTSPEIDKVRNILDHVDGKCKTCSIHKEEDCYGCPCRKIYKKGTDSLYEGSNCFEDII